MVRFLRSRVNARSSWMLGLSLASFLAIALPGQVAAQGLALDKATEKTLDALDEPNPHMELDCTDCHGKKPTSQDTWRTVDFTNDDKGTVDLCYGCHDESDNIHPIHVDPAVADPPVKVPPHFPMERWGEKKGTVVCSTCHFIHTETRGNKLLRGLAVSSRPEDVKKAKYKDRRDFCKGCHGDNLSKKSPHKGKTADKQNCSFCHATEPKEGEPIEFTKGIVELCDFCHAASKGAHFLLVNPFADPNLAAEVAATDLPMIGGEFTCVTCHGPHGTELDKFLRPAFVDLALKSQRVRPHFMKALCEACHTVKPKAAKGEPGAQPLSEIPLRSDDPNELCNRCHESGLSKANAHPIVPVSDSFKEKIPADWPLYNGSLTCLTCHTGGDSPVFDEENPNFLRGAPYLSRNDICWTCHDEDEFAELDPHERIQDMEGCEFCHTTRPDPEKMDSGGANFKGDIVLLCIRCHSADPHPSGHDHTGAPNKEFMVEKRITLPAEFPLDRLGRLTCATCHNPHAYGEMRNTLPGMMVCPNCHSN